MALTLKQWIHRVTAPSRTKFSYAIDTPPEEINRLTYLESVRAIVDDANNRISITVGTDYHSARVFYILMESVEKLEQIIQEKNNNDNDSTSS